MSRATPSRSGRRRFAGVLLIGPVLIGAGCSSSVDTGSVDARGTPAGSAAAAGTSSRVLAPTTATTTGPGRAEEQTTTASSTTSSSTTAPTVPATRAATTTSTSSPATPATPPAPPETAPGAPEAPVREIPPLPTGGTDCGTVNLMSGWPTTAPRPPGSNEAPCLMNALAAGTPARMVFIFSSGIDRGRRTSDGYAIPAATVTSFVVLGPQHLEVTVDERESGGPRTVQRCTGLTVASDAALPQPTGCTPA